MQSITLKEFCNKLKYYPHAERNLSHFAELTGISLSYISKLYNARPVSSGGPAWDKLSTFVASYGYELITAHPTDYLVTNMSKKNNELKQINADLTTENNMLKAEIESLYELICISKRIADYENDRRTIKCRKLKDH